MSCKAVLQQWLEWIRQRRTTLNSSKGVRGDDSSGTEEVQVGLAETNHPVKVSGIDDFSG